MISVDIVAILLVHKRFNNCPSSSKNKSVVTGLPMMLVTPPTSSPGVVSRKAAVAQMSGRD